MPVQSWQLALCALISKRHLDDGRGRKAGIGQVTYVYMPVCCRRI